METSTEETDGDTLRANGLLVAGRCFSLRPPGLDPGSVYLVTEPPVPADVWPTGNTPRPPPPVPPTTPRCYHDRCVFLLVPAEEKEEDEEAAVCTSTLPQGR